MIFSMNGNCLMNIYYFFLAGVLLTGGGVIDSTWIYSNNSVSENTEHSVTGGRLFWR